MLQNFQIVNINNEPQKMLCVQFMYKGFLISASKILTSKVIASDENDLDVREGDTIEEVIIAIDLMIEQRD